MHLGTSMAALDGRAVASPARDELVAELRATTARFADLARCVPDPTTRVERSEWTAGELIAHVTGGLEAYARYVAGDTAPVVDVSDIADGTLAATNAARLAEEPERSVDRLLERAAVALDGLTAWAARCRLDDTVLWHGAPVTSGCLLAAAIAEQLIHGRDLAASIGARWTISRHQALLVLEHIRPALGLLLDRRATADVVAAVRIRLRGGPPLTVRFDHATLVVDDDLDRVDATISADPVAFLLVAYGRTSQWRQIMSLRLVAWGRRPWIALRLTSYLVHP